jgi:DNA-binding LacI/PurR family transcriptional regulator
MADIARLSGVSSATVSRALNGDPAVKKVTSDRVLEVARSLNYQINVGAANLRKREVRTIGVLMLAHLQMVSDPFILSLVGHIADELEQHGLNMLLSRYTQDRDQSISALVDTGQASGLILIGQLSIHDQLNALADRGLPFVVWGGISSDERYCVVGGDNLTGGYLATRHLIENGCQQIAYIGDVTFKEGKLRHDGYLRALEEYGIPVTSDICKPLLLRESELRPAINNWLDSGVRFDGLVATSDVSAMHLISALAARGLSVPGDVKVVGYDDVPMASHMVPSLSSIRQPTDLAAKAMVKNLICLLNQQKPESVMLPADLVIRQSSQ